MNSPEIVYVCDVFEGRGTLSRRGLFWKRELTELCAKVGDFFEQKLFEIALVHK